MKAKIKTKEIYNAKNMRHDKELVNQLQVVGLYKNKMYRVVDAQFYMGRSNSSSVAYCSIWVSSKHQGVYVSGHGSARGYGYHKESAALQAAIQSAQIDLFSNEGKKKYIDGVVDNAMNKALEAIAKAAGFRKTIIV